MHVRGKLFITSQLYQALRVLTLNAIYYCLILYYLNQPIPESTLFQTLWLLKVHAGYSSVLFKWEFFIQMRATNLPPSSLYCPSFLVEGKRHKRQLSFEWKSLIWIGHYSSVCCEKSTWIYTQSKSREQVVWESSPNWWLKFVSWSLIGGHKTILSDVRKRQDVK